MPPAPRTSKLTKLRTYQDDLARVRGSLGTPAKEPERAVVTSDTPSPAAVRPAPTKPASVPVRFKPKARTDDSFTPIAPDRPKRTVVPQAISAPAPAPAVAKTPAPRPPSTPSIPPARPVPQRDLTSFVQDDLAKIKTVRSRSILSAEEGTFDMQGLNDSVIEEGTIVTDTKRTKQRFIPAIIEALKGWFTSQKEAYEERQRPKYTVAPAATRKDVIERAAAASALAPKDDHANVAKRLRHVPRTTRTHTDVSLKRAEEVPRPSWSHVIEPETEPTTPPQQQAAAEAALHDLEAYATPTPPVAPTEEPPAVEPEPTMPAVPVTAEETVPEPVPEPEPIEPPTPEPQVMPEPVPEPIPAASVDPLPEYEPDPEPVPEPVVAPAASALPTRFARPQQKRSPYPLVIGVVIASVLGIVVSFWLFGGSADRIDPVRSDAPQVITADQTQGVALGATHAQLLANLTEGMDGASPSGITQLYPIVATNSGSTRAATTEEILTVLDARAPGGFLRAVSEIGFGVYRGGAPFIIMKVSSFDIALGGMLLWEDTMSADLAPLFGTPVTSTFDPTARTATQTRDPFFVDAVHANRDIRILHDGAGDERIVYSFLDRTTILISTDRTVIEKVAPLVQ